MRVFDKTCPACQTTFEAKRRNQLYCTPECRADINNDKLKAKFNNIKTLEKEKSVGDKYKAAYLSAVRIVKIDFDRKGELKRPGSSSPPLRQITRLHNIHPHGQIALAESVAECE